MYECEYSREPVDYRLIWLRFLKSIWIFFVCAIIGAAVVGGIHSIKKLVVSGGRSYQAESLYYFEYGCSTEVLTTTAYNYYTWGEIGKSDLIVDALLEKVGDKVSREELRASITLTCDSDVRYVYSRVTTHDRNLSVEIAKAMESVLPAFVLNHKEFSDAYVVTHAESAIEVTNYRIGNAIILGCFIGFVSSIIIWLIIAISDTSVYIPATIEKRYHVATLTAPSMEEFETNCRKFLSDSGLIGLFSLDGETVLVDEVSKYGDVVNITAKDLLEKSNSTYGAVIVELKAANHNGKKLERALEELARLGIPASYIVLVKEDEKLIKSYYKR